MLGIMQALFSNFGSKYITICCKNSGNKAIDYNLKTTKIIY